MLSLFTKPLELLTCADVQRVIGWPESITVEFKREIPRPDGRSDAWADRGKIDEHGRDRIFKEIVALANTVGGHLIIGVAESKGKPPTANSITPIPRCAELAERLLQSAQSIDPPIPFLVATGISTADSAGIVMFRVPASRMAPHRSTDKEIYVRRGTNSVPISMREVRDIVLAMERGSNVADQTFSAASASFRSWLGSPFNHQTLTPTVFAPFGFRVTAMPVGGRFELPRLYGRWHHSMLTDRFLVNKNEVRWLHRPQLTRSMLRGVEMRFRDNDNPTYVTIQTDGTISTASRFVSSPGRTSQICLRWILGSMLGVLRLADRWRDEAGIPECEYAVETEIASTTRDSLELHAWGSGWGDHLGNLVPDRLPLVFPRLSYGAQGEVNEVISRFADDYQDSVEATQEAPSDLRVSQPT